MAPIIYFRIFMSHLADQMIQRDQGVCDSCRTKFILRTTAPLASTDRFRFCCPGCGIEESATLTLDYLNTRIILEPTGFQLVNYEGGGTGPIITISTDLPVPRAAAESPFIQLVGDLGGTCYNNWRAKLDGLHKFRSDHSDSIRKLVDYVRAGNWQMADRILRERFDEQSSYSTPRIIGATYDHMARLYEPLIAPTEMAGYLAEYEAYLTDCRINKEAAFKSLMTEISADALYVSFRKKVLSVYLEALLHFDAFMVGLLYNEMPDALKARIDEFRTFRDDYPRVKSLYQDIFELTSQLMIFLGAVVNLSVRGKAWHYVTGKTTLNAFRKESAIERLKILTEFTGLATLLDSVSRVMRNTIGHFDANYEASTGNLKYDDGTEKNYIVFLGEFFAAVKALWFMTRFIGANDSDMNRLGFQLPTGITLQMLTQPPSLSCG